ncbi:TMEM175 family protein [Lysobacter solisilvae (ex Woo and Kim 2020)]|uniref:DUF1211 domain-containing protein n=1 Tax=Agrilutibacter terrestris TaxID=2865112 RepID=A0A7H0FUL4_9GAMM|nr:TMEM175 family protein [Lysobacter terrestris]QNP39730.1 DUF1211 domain-containing protein [Lysobacter terrestris]
MPPKATPERLTLFSDGVFAVLITILVLELHPPAQPTYAALLALWPRWVSYSMSYLFIAIVWMNHHYLLRHAREATPRLLWTNFALLFAMSLVPLSTAWMAQSRLAPAPVSFYALVFILVNAAYLCLIEELIGRAPDEAVPAWARLRMRQRAVFTLALFVLAALVGLFVPLAALALCLVCLIVYLRPGPPGA